MRIAFVGLGVMGRPMARRLLEAGHELVVVARRPAVAAELERLGARSAPSPAAAAEGAEAMVTMLPDSPQVLEVVCGEDGLLAGAPPGSLLVDMSTIAPAAAEEVYARGREHGLDVLDAPVSGGEQVASEGSLSVMVGGDAAAFERARPLLEILGSTVIHVGGPGSGQVAKACNQIVVALVIEALAEALTLGTAAGVDAAKLLQIIGGGLGGNRVIELKGKKLTDHEFSPGFRIDLHRKDLRIALEAAAERGVVLPTAPVVAQVMQVLSSHGRGDDDHTALLAAVELLSGRAGTRPDASRSN